MSKSRTPRSILIKAVHAEALETVSLSGVTREILTKILPESHRFPSLSYSTLAHQFGRRGQLHRIQHLLQPEDYDLKSEFETGGSEPPLYCFAYTEDSIKCLPCHLFTEERLFAIHETDEAHVWIHNLISTRCVQLIPTSGIPKARLFEACHPDFRADPLFGRLIETGQTEGIYPTLISSDDILKSPKFSSIMRSVSRSKYEIKLTPTDFSSFLEAVTEAWDRNRETSESRKWVIA